MITLTRMGNCQVLSQRALWQVCGVISVFWMGTCGQKDKGQPQFSASKLWAGCSLAWWLPRKLSYLREASQGWARF